MSESAPGGIGVARRPSRPVRIGKVIVGGDAPISVQTMAKTDTRDIAATVAQLREVEMAGCDIARLAVVDAAAAGALAAIKSEVAIPLIADIHFDHRLALRALESGVDGLRINPGNIGGEAAVRDVVTAARERSVPIRIGVNSGSLEQDIAARHGGATPKALVESAMRHVRMLEALDYREIKVSIKASDVHRTVVANRLFARETDYPLHLGITEAGTFMAGTVRSAVGIGLLLADGIGDTIRVSLTDVPSREVAVGLELLRCLGLREPGPHVISCPTCGRVQVDVAAVAREIEGRLDAYYREQPAAVRPTVAVMGCMVNGPGESKEADIALAGGRGRFALYERGQHVATVGEGEAVAAVLQRVRDWHP